MGLLLEILPLRLAGLRSMPSMGPSSASSPAAAAAAAAAPGGGSGAPAAPMQAAQSLPAGVASGSLFPPSPAMHSAPLPQGAAQAPHGGSGRVSADLPQLQQGVGLGLVSVSLCGLRLPDVLTSPQSPQQAQVGWCTSRYLRRRLLASVSLSRAFLLVMPAAASPSPARHSGGQWLVASRQHEGEGKRAAVDAPPLSPPPAGAVRGAGVRRAAAGPGRHVPGRAAAPRGSLPGAPAPLSLARTQHRRPTVVIACQARPCAGPDAQQSAHEHAAAPR